MHKILLETYGCTLNQADSDIMEGMLKASGFEVERAAGAAPIPRPGESIIVNTCTVKKATEQKISHRLKVLHASGANVVVTGCMAGANPDIIRANAPNAKILPPGRIAEIPKAFGFGNGISEKAGIKNPDKSGLVPASGTVVSRIPLSEGCLSSCNFCETKFARGPLRSFSEELILKAIEKNVAMGSKEIELTAQDVGAYGLDRKTNIAELAAKVGGISGEFMVRIGMLNPEHLWRYMDGIAEALNSERLYKFIHLPLQSGSNKILKSMGRRYSIEDFTAHVKELRRKTKGITIETDLIVGYPGETEEDFSETLEAVSRIKPTITNISKFTPRPHATASGMKQLANSVIKERCVRLSRHVRQMQHEEFSRMVGSVQKTLITEKNRKSVSGKSLSYLSVAVTNCTDAHLGKFEDVRIDSNSYACLIGRSEAHSL